MTEEIKKLRDQTGMSVMACKKALEAAGGDWEKALLFLRKEGKRVAEKKSGRSVAEGVIGVYKHSNQRIGALVEVRCETDFVAKNEEFQEFVHNIAMHIAATAPRFVAPEDIPEETLAELRIVVNEEVRTVQKPAGVMTKIIEGKMERYKKAMTLLEQEYIKDQNLTVGEYVNEAIQKFGENIRIMRFARFEI
ncbi:MAG: elongation factor Ts [Parcubacteria group bacterium]|nr:elongation factor Ts [Parcubacteria group bacterium]